MRDLCSLKFFCVVILPKCSPDLPSSVTCYDPPFFARTLIIRRSNKCFMHATTPEICNNVDKQDIDDLHNVFHMLPFFWSDVGLVQRASKTHARGCGIFCQTLRNSREVDGEEGKALELAGNFKTLQASMRDSVVLFHRIAPLSIVSQGQLWWK